MLTFAGAQGLLNYSRIVLQAVEVIATRFKINQPDKTGDKILTTENKNKLRKQRISNDSHTTIN